MGDNEDKKDALSTLLSDDEDGLDKVEQFLITQFDPEPRIQAIERLLNGEKWDGEAWIVPQGVEPMANPQGVAIIISKIRSLLNPDSVNGYMKEEEFNELMTEFNFELTRVINRDRKHLGIKKGYTKFIIDMIDHRIRTFLSGAIEGRRAELITHIMAKKNIERNPQLKKDDGGVLKYLIR